MPIAMAPEPKASTPPMNPRRLSAVPTITSNSVSSGRGSFNSSHSSQLNSVFSMSILASSVDGKICVAVRAAHGP